MDIVFNASMLTSFNHSSINLTNTDVYIEPALSRDQEENFNVSKVNLTWAVESYENSTLTIKLNFTSPVSISPLAVQDRLVVHFREEIRGLFFSPEINRFLEPEYFTMRKKVRK